MDLSLGLPGLDDADLLDSMGLGSNLDFTGAPAPEADVNSMGQYGAMQQQQHPQSQQQPMPQAPHPHDGFANSAAYWPNNNAGGMQMQPPSQMPNQGFQPVYPDAFAGADLLSMPPPDTNSDFLGLQQTGLAPHGMLTAKTEHDTHPSTAAPKPAPKRKTKPSTKASAGAAAAAVAEPTYAASVGSGASDAGGSDDKPKQKRRREKLTPEEREARKKERLLQRRMKKSEREKLRRNRENQLFDELADLCDLGKDNRDKSSILAAVIKTIAEEEGEMDGDDDDDSGEVGGATGFGAVKQEGGLASQLSALMNGLSGGNAPAVRNATMDEQKVNHAGTYMSMAPPASVSMSAPVSEYAMPTMPPPQSVPPTAGYSSSGGHHHHEHAQQRYSSQDYAIEHQQRQQQEQERQRLFQHQQQYVARQGGGADPMLNTLMGPPSSIIPQTHQQQQQQHIPMQASPFAPPPNVAMTSAECADMKDIFPMDDDDESNKFTPFGFGELGPDESSLMQT